MRGKEREREQCHSALWIIAHAASHIVTNVTYDIEVAAEKFIRRVEENDDIAYGSVERRVNA